MSTSSQGARRVAIACGGTGGHLFPGLAVAEELAGQDCDLTLLVSPKDVDQQALRSVAGLNVVTLPAVGLERGRVLEFCSGFRQSCRVARAEFLARRPDAIVAMGGFTSAPPVWVGKRLGAATFLHESNTIPGRANRWLSWVVDFAFTGFPEAGARLHARRIKVTGTPVRRAFRPRPVQECKQRFGLDPSGPVVLVMGGSQGASGINELVCRALPLLKERRAAWQWLHLSGPADAEKLRAAYAAHSLRAVVLTFCSEMELALGAASVGISRAGASALAELAQMQVPAALMPYPSATDNHQHLNARFYEQAGAAILLKQQGATPECLAARLVSLMEDEALRATMQQALKRLQRPEAAKEIADIVLAGIADRTCLQNPFSQKGIHAGRTQARSMSRPFERQSAPALVKWNTPPA